MIKTGKEDLIADATLKARGLIAQREPRSPVEHHLVVSHDRLGESKAKALHSGEKAEIRRQERAVLLVAKYPFYPALNGHHLVRRSALRKERQISHRHRGRPVGCQWPFPQEGQAWARLVRLQRSVRDDQIGSHAPGVG